jgi:hypothetical protein
MQLLIWDTRHDDVPCIGCTLDLVNGRLWFASEKRYFPGEIAEFNIRMGWKRRIACTLQVVSSVGSLAGDFAYIGEFVEIEPDDLQELTSVICGHAIDCQRSEPISIQPTCLEHYCAAV